MNEVKNVLWKYDKELGIAYFCPNCKKFLCTARNKCIYCGQRINWRTKESYKGKVEWE